MGIRCGTADAIPAPLISACPDGRRSGPNLEVGFEGLQNLSAFGPALLVPLGLLPRASYLVD